MASNCSWRMLVRSCSSRSSLATMLSRGVPSATAFSHCMPVGVWGEDQVSSGASWKLSSTKSDGCVNSGEGANCGAPLPPLSLGTG
jgi:hypothetical protein